MAAGIGIVTRLSSGVNQIVVPASTSRAGWASFPVAALLLVRWGTDVVDRDGHGARVNYVGGSAASLETLAAASFCR